MHLLARPSGTRLASFLPAHIPEPRVDLFADAASDDGYGEPMGNVSAHFIRLGRSIRALGHVGHVRAKPNTGDGEGQFSLFNGLRETRGQSRTVSPPGSDTHPLCLQSCTRLYHFHGARE